MTFQFCKRPIVIEAVQWNGHGLSIPLPGWFAKAWGDRTIDRDADDRSKLKITTREGIMTAGADDWIVKGVKDELYPIKDHIFRETYDPVANQEDG